MKTTPQEHAMSNVLGQPARPARYRKLLAEVSYGDVIDGRLRAPSWRGLITDHHRRSTWRRSG